MTDNLAASAPKGPAWPDYARIDYYRRRHDERYKARVEAMQHKLICQECRGTGGWTEPILDDGSGPWEYCGICNGTGYVTPWMRGQWLRWKKQERKAIPGTEWKVWRRDDQ